MIWRTIQVIGLVIFLISIGAMFLMKSWWLGAFITGLFLMFIGKALRFITKDK